MSMLDRDEAMRELRIITEEQACEIYSMKSGGGWFNYFRSLPSAEPIIKSEAELTKAKELIGRMSLDVDKGLSRSVCMIGGRVGEDLKHFTDCLIGLKKLIAEAGEILK